MKFKKVNLAGVSGFVPESLDLSVPIVPDFPPESKHFLIFIPWKDHKLNLVPLEYRDFFKFVLPYLRKRTTDVHTAHCLNLATQFLKSFSEINKRVVLIALTLHDIGWSQLTSSEIAQSLGVKGLALNSVARGPKLAHALAGEKLAAEILAVYQFNPPLTKNEKEIILKSVRYHDEPEKVIKDHQIVKEVKLLVDLDHFWSFTQANFWQDTLRKKVVPQQYLLNLKNDLNDYFTTAKGKEFALNLWNERRKEVLQLAEQIKLMN